MITQEYLKSILQYNENTGKFIYKIKIKHSRLHVGANAGTFDNENYNIITINKKSYKAHRLAWLYVYGVWPKNQIDHINGIRNDNRINNLRDVTSSQNQRNKKIHRTGKLIGCTFDKQRKKWRVLIYKNKKKIYIGLYKTQIEAIEAHNAMDWLINEVNKL